MNIPVHYYIFAQLYNLLVTFPSQTFPLYCAKCFFIPNFMEAVRLKKLTAAQPVMKLASFTRF